MNINIRDVEIINQLVINNTSEQIFEFICTLDWRMASYDFTYKLKKHFDSEIEKEDKIELDSSPKI